MRLLRDLLAILLVAGGVYFWKHRPVPVPPPAIRGPRPNLTMPAAPGLRPAEAPDSVGDVVADNETPKPRLAGKMPTAERPEVLGDKPQILGEPATDVTDPRARGVLDSETSPWEERLRRPWAIGAIVALFLLLYALGTRALRKGPGGGGFTHD